MSGQRSDPGSVGALSDVYPAIRGAVPPMCDAIRSIVPLLVNADAPLARPARRGAEHVLEVVIPATDECVAALVCIASLPCRMDVYGTKASYVCHGDDRLLLLSTPKKLPSRLDVE